jgi:hypothetical protein
MDMNRSSIAVLWVILLASWVAAQKDPGVRGGINNTGGGLQQQGIPIPHQLLKNYLADCDRFIEEQRQEHPTADVRVKTPTGRIVDMITYD